MPHSEELALMRRIDELHLQLLVHADVEGASTVNRKSMFRRRNTRLRGLARAAEPGVGHGYHLHPDPGFAYLVAIIDWYPARRGGCTLLPLALREPIDASANRQLTGPGLERQAVRQPTASARHRRRGRCSGPQAPCRKQFRHPLRLPAGSRSRRPQRIAVCAPAQRQSPRR